MSKQTSSARIRSAPKKVREGRRVEERSEQVLFGLRSEGTGERNVPWNSKETECSGLFWLCMDAVYALGVQRTRACSHGLMGWSQSEMLLVFASRNSGVSSSLRASLVRCQCAKNPSSPELPVMNSGDMKTAEGARCLQ